jgi:hypothetical protein
MGLDVGHGAAQGGLYTEFADPEFRVSANPELPDSLLGGLERRVVYLQDGDDPEFVERWLDTGLTNTPVFFPDAFARWPDRYARALRSVATAP